MEIASPERALWQFQRPLASLGAKPMEENHWGWDAFSPGMISASSFSGWHSSRGLGPQPADKRGFFKQTHASIQWNLYIFDNKRLKGEA